MGRMMGEKTETLEQGRRMARTARRTSLPVLQVLFRAPCRAGQLEWAPSEDKELQLSAIAGPGPLNCFS